MGAEKQICCGIMICQMTAILSGVALMYLSVIVVIPSMKELEFNFHADPIMCTTVEATDIAAGGKKVKCEWATCNEWCLSKTSAPCMQIYVMPRVHGARVDVEGCEFVEDKTCSALNVTLTNKKLCKKGECKELTGTFNCSKTGDNECRDISAGYLCSKGVLNKTTTIICNEEKCASRLNGVYVCNMGECNKMEGLKSYLDCERKCENLDLTNANTVIFSKERLITGKCSFANSTANAVNEINDADDWKNGEKVFFIFCTYVEKESLEDEVFDFKMEDCFNGTMREKGDITGVKSYLTMIDKRGTSTPTTQWLLGPENTLRIMNDTKLKINPEGCVNTLIKECQAFFVTHATDGRDGKTADRYPCFFTNSTSAFVIGKYDPESTYLFLLLASTVPAVLFAVSCFCLFFCSKSVGVDEGGNLKVTLLNKGGLPAGPQNDPLSEL